jgi:drug/metabolite transporter (DMT)-like permease
VVRDRRSYMTLAAVCTGWGTIPAVAARTGLPAAPIVAGRVWIASLGLGAVLLATRAPGPRLLSVQPVRCVATGVVLAAHWTAMFAAYERAPASTVIFVIFLAPVGIAALAPRALGERAGARTIVALVVAVGGFALVAGPTARETGAAGLALAAFAGALFVWLVLASKPLAEAYGGLRLTLQQMAIAGVAILPVALRASWGPPRAAWLWLAVLGLAHTAVGTGLYLGALARVPATHTGILGYLEPAGVVLFSWVLSDQVPTAWTVVGGILIVVAGALVISGDAPPVTPEVPADVVPG